MLPAIIEEAPGAEPPGWRTRVVPNKYPILAAAAKAPPAPALAGYGWHEVIIDTPRHDADFTELGPDAMEAVVDTWHRRYVAALALPGIEAVTLFRNRGSGAGASLGHPHSQLVALPLVPTRLEASRAWARAWHEKHRRCPVCEELLREIDAGERLVELAPEFAVLVPFAASGPLEQWIVPREHLPSFALAGRASAASLGAVLQRAIGRMKAIAGNPAYNLIVEAGSPHEGHAQWAHWAIRIMPTLTKRAGFELLSGLSVNHASPEDDASRLREACAFREGNGKA